MRSVAAAHQVPVSKHTSAVPPGHWDSDPANMDFWLVACSVWFLQQPHYFKFVFVLKYISISRHVLPTFFLFVFSMYNISGLKIFHLNVRKNVTFSKNSDWCLLK